MRLEGIVADVIQAPKLEPRIMRHELGVAMERGIAAAGRDADVLP